MASLPIPASSLTTQFTSKPFSLFSPKPISSSSLLSFPKPTTIHLSRRQRSTPLLAAAESLETPDVVPDVTAEAEPQVADEQAEEKELQVVVKGMEKPRLVLRFIWMEKNIGLALDQVIPGHGTIPLSPYYWWPRKDAWEELKAKLEEKPWISQKRMIILLNQATDIINLWQQSGAAAL